MNYEIVNLEKKIVVGVSAMNRNDLHCITVKFN